MAQPKDLTFLDGVSDIDWARLAMCIDGEGCISIKSVKGYDREWSRRVLYIDLTIVNTDFRLTAWLKQTFGGSANIRKKGQPHHQPAVVWNVAARHAATLIRKALPYFIAKRDQADIALAFQDTICTDHRWGCKGRPAAYVEKQYALREQLSALRGPNARLKIKPFSKVS